LQIGKFNRAASILSNIRIHISRESQKLLFRKDFALLVYDRFLRIMGLLEIEPEERNGTVEWESRGAVCPTFLHGLISDGFCLQTATNTLWSWSINKSPRAFHRSRRPGFRKWRGESERRKRDVGKREMNSNFSMLLVADRGPLQPQSNCFLLL
jgi:hypothetical protein